MTDITERLALIIDGHTDGAVSAVRRLSLEEKAAADRAEVLQAKIADLNTRIARSVSGGTNAQRQQLSKLTGEYNNLTAGLAKTPALASKAEQALSKVGLSGIVPSGALGAIGKAAPGLVAGAAAFGGFEFLKAGVSRFEELATQIRAVQQASGATAPEASALVEITNALGVDSQSAALGMFRLGKNIDLTPQKLQAYGIAVARTRDGNTDLIGTLSNVADAYQKTTDPARRAAIVYEAFGRAGTTMLPILNANREQLKAITDEAKKTGVIFSDGDLQRARELQIATHEMKDAIDGLGLAAAKTLVPALTRAADLVTGIVNSSAVKAAGSRRGRSLLGGIVNAALDGVPDLLGLASHHGGKSAAEKAATEIQAQQDKAAQQALANAALGTLAGGFDTLTGPQNQAAAKQGLIDAKNAVASARAEREKAIRTLDSLKSGGSKAGAAEIEAATARITAAEANLRKALYVGGDARVAGARATLLTDQARLNTLRGQGGTDTNKLADATERLRRANLAVTSAQAKAKAAQKTANDATGLNAQEVLARLTGQARSQQGLAGANVKLAAAGLSDEVIGGLDKLEQQVPGTLVKVARGVNAGIVQQLNAQQSALDAAQQEFAAAASNPSLFVSAGKAAGDSFVGAFNDTLRAGLPSYQPAVPASLPRNFKVGDLAKPNSGIAGLSAAYGAGGTTINVGTVKVDSRTGAQLAHDLAKHTRRGNLGTPVPTP